MDFSMSSKAFIHTPGTRSDMTTIIQVELLFVVWHECNSTFIIFSLFLAGEFTWAFSTSVAVQKFASILGLL